MNPISENIIIIVYEADMQLHLEYAENTGEMVNRRRIVHEDVYEGMNDEEVR